MRAMPSNARLTRSISGPQYFAMAFGSVVGVAWIVVLGGAVSAAGPAGTAFALGLGGLAVLLVALCYAEMAARLPSAGGEMVYAHTLGGAPAAYATGWTMALIYTAACAFEAITIGQLFGLLFPGIEGPVLYHILGADVHAGGLIAGGAIALALALLNAAGARGTALTQEWVTYARILLMFTFLGIALIYAKPVNLQPLVPGTSPALQFSAFLGVLATAPFWFAGFNVTATVAEESNTSMRVAGRAIVYAVLGAVLFYVVLTFAISALVPRTVLGGLELPAAQAFEIAMGGPEIARLVMITALLGNLTAWNALLMAGSRVFFALGRAKLSPMGFARLNSRGTPVTGIVLVTAATLIALPLGRGFIMPIVNLTSACFGVTYAVTCLALLRLRRDGSSAAFTVPGGRRLIVAALVASLAIFCVALIQPWFNSSGQLPPEWLTGGTWGMLATLLWLAGRRRILSVRDTARAALLRGRAEDGADDTSAQIQSTGDL
jgi:basic amino acid/polyamine antiporter, APA family